MRPLCPAVPQPSIRAAAHSTERKTSVDVAAWLHRPCSRGGGPAAE
jgi:hypothetical protein